MTFKTFLCLTLLAFFSNCKSSQSFKNYESEQIKILKISPHTFLHISYLETEQYGKVPCNGMIAFDKGEAVIFDTPATNEASEELINWVEQELKCKITGIVPTHFHVDCLGGLDAFHNNNIPSYASQLTIELAKADNDVLPQNGFSDNLDLKVGNKKVHCKGFGGGHTKDNIVAYFPDDEVLFGGCLIKSVGAGKGNLADANVEEWSGTVSKIKEKYKNLKVVIPGHGKTGGIELLDFTINLFK